MTVDIHYCTLGNYKPHADRVAAELKESHGVEANLVKGTNGIFDVVVDGRAVYSRRETGRFPKANEVSGLL